MADVDASAIAPWLQAGGLLAFATFVSIELRSLRPVLHGVRELLTSLLERERMRSEQRERLIELRTRQASDPPPARRGTRPIHDPPEGWDETTDQFDEPIPKPKRRTDPFGHPTAGLRAPTKGEKDR